ncbi:BrnA antitoxin family protein [Orrella sp. 11846]|uniref:BrnA antitoxin family protein n=1 Tax=Orrella sp. 11846 TaxID=3409913 RepID=UPI003B596284
MNSAKKPLIDAEGEVRELTATDLKKFAPASEVLPPELQAKIGMRRRGPQKEATKERITIRLSSNVVESFRATGPGWQSRIDNALSEWLATHRPS